MNGHQEQAPKVLITGATGQLGRALIAAKTEGLDLLAPSSRELDLTDGSMVHRVIAETRPDLIINAAAITAPERAETEQELALAVNARGVESLARAAKDVGAALLHISTDHVFDGSQDKPYTETDHTAPLNMYGATKLLGEELAQLACPRTAILRTSSLHALWGHNRVTSALADARQGKPVAAASDRISNATSVEVLAATCLKIAPLLVEADPYSDFWGVTHCAALDACRETDLLGEAFRQATIDTELLVPTELIDWPTSAAHPKDTTLDCARMVRVFGIQPPTWREHLARTMRPLNPVQATEAA